MGSGCCSCKNNRELQEYNSKHERALIEYRSHSAERYEHDYKGPKYKKKKKELTTYQAMQEAKKKVQVQKHQTVQYTDLMAARRLSDKQKADIANMSIKANIKTKVVQEVKPRAKADIKNAKSSYAQSEMKAWIRNNSTKKNSDVKKKVSSNLDTSVSNFGRRKYTTTKAADFGPLRQ